METELTEAERKAAAREFESALREFAGTLSPYVEYGPDKRFKSPGDVAAHQRMKAAEIGDGGFNEEETLP